MSPGYGLCRAARKVWPRSETGLRFVGGRETVIVIGDEIRSVPIGRKNSLELVSAVAREVKALARH